MPDTAAALAEFRRYASLLDAMIAADPAFAPTLESATSIHVERGVVLPRVMKGGGGGGVVERLIEVTSGGEIARLAVIDQAGHHRPVYRPLLVYCWLQAFRIVYEKLPRSEFGRWEEGIRPWCDLLEAGLGEIAWSSAGFPASRGGVAVEAAWTALALYVAGKVYIRDAWTDLAADTFGRLTRGQQSSGAFLQTTASDNPESTWYHELAILHAAASYAVQAEDRTVAAAVARAAAYHVAETQPDHATEQPWGLFAFIWSPSARPLADQLLHAMTINQPGGARGVPLMLLADALYCLRLFL
jgi:hypothetical protein